MEDFVREIETGSSLFLLYGDDGVGKSRLLLKLKADRLNHKSIRFIDFDTEQENETSDLIKQIAANATEGDVIIFDHFESATNKSQQQIFDSWSTEGRDKNLNMIVCASSAGFNRFRHLAHQYELEAMSFKLLPCDRAESEAYLLHLLYPDHAFATLALPTSVKRLLHQSKGLFSRLREIADHHSDLINIKHEIESASRTLPFVIIFSLLIGIAAAGYFFHLSQSSTDIELANTEIQSGPNVPVSGSEPEPEPELEPEPVPELATDSGSIEVSEPMVEVESVINTPAYVIQNDDVAESDPNWFKQRLVYSHDWIHNSNSNRGTIQIMSIGVERFNAGNFQAYLDGLREQGLDISQLRLFETQAGNRAVYTLIFGDYIDRHEANRQIGFLPEILGAEKPIPRSTGSIAREIAINNSN